jgi:hypothetical protein
MNTKKIENRNLRKSLKRASRSRLKLLDNGLTVEQRKALRRARKEKTVGLKAFLAKQK